MSTVTVAFGLVGALYPISLGIEYWLKRQLGTLLCVREIESPAYCYEAVVMVVDQGIKIHVLAARSVSLLFCARLRKTAPKHYLGRCWG